jgi:hypothetical protein
MGLETAALVMAGVAVASEAGKSAMEVKAADEQEQALDLQGKELQLQTQQKTLSNYDVMEKVIQAQEAHMTTTGVAFSSPSYNAIQRQTVNIAARKQQNIDTENELAQENLDIEKKNVRTSLFAQLFGNAADVAFQGANIYSKAPKKLPQLEA